MPFDFVKCPAAHSRIRAASSDFARDPVRAGRPERLAAGAGGGFGIG
jgi:hypothetical protein